MNNNTGKYCSGCNQEFTINDHATEIDGWLWHANCYKQAQIEQMIAIGADPSCAIVAIDWHTYKDTIRNALTSSWEHDYSNGLFSAFFGDGSMLEATAQHIIVYNRYNEPIGVMILSN